MPMVPKLILVEPSGARREIALDRTPFTIGRHPDNLLCLHDGRISRQHAVIHAINGHFFIEDCPSRRGTFVNGSRVSARLELRNQDRIEFGVADSYALIFVSEEESLKELLNRIETPPRPYAVSQDLYKLDLLLEVGRTLHAGLSLEDVLRVVVDACLKVTNTERGCILLRNDSGQMEFRVGRSRRARSLPAEDFDLAHPGVRQAAEKAREMIVPQTRIEARGAAAEPRPPTLICLPLFRPPSLGASTSVAGTVRDVLGVLYLDSRERTEPVSDTDRQILRSLALEAAAVIESARLFTTARAKAQLDQELAIARSIQQKLLPRGCRQQDFFQVACVNIPCHEVGGDYFDVIEQPDGSCVFVMADVSGKGISAALLSSTLQGALAAGMHWGQPLAAVANHLNRYLCQHTEPGTFATCFCGLLAPDGRFQYVNAGHFPCLWISASEVQPLASEYLPLGLDESTELATREIHLRPQDVLVLYSDGVLEAPNPREELYGSERLKHTLSACCQEPPEQQAETLLEDILRFTQGTPLGDDVSLMIARYTGRH